MCYRSRGSCKLVRAVVVTDDEYKSTIAREKRMVTSPYLVIRLQLPHAMGVVSHAHVVNIVSLKPETATGRIPKIRRSQRYILVLSICLSWEDFRDSSPSRDVPTRCTDCSASIQLVLVILKLKKTRRC